MGSVEFRERLDDALKKAFAASDPRVRLAYMDLAEFYERQVRRYDGLGPSVGNAYVR